ncbi:MAG: iron-sulfur cluster assembly scaffold protein [Syntrophotalea acetylenica]|jgi:nitrogen fixation NifU-like protein|uniref:iron-sulfur cluster assembly scaffold protein n=1 Tax=Syntrophotalea TaxID=2812025 RepID=UPI002A359F1D|nr:iron-sulfur cluster assembly scaffold protein [Syntrophotalea acetylenica]MDD4456734.1 iron-sulfur cluster assembly scaffold protein [Syntrophotalea acetylenica]MDY0261738.1 iron-sulfur cluster assembly scaffold protein [Syntrophotalea acetylenica]
MYSKLVMEHFNQPRNVGYLDNPSVAIQYGDPACGDCLLVFLKIEQGVITDMKYKVMGCAAAIATASITSEMSIGLTVEQALELTEKDVVIALGGLPPQKVHCSNLAVGALKAALRVYLAGDREPEAVINAGHDAKGPSNQGD